MRFSSLFSALYNPGSAPYGLIIFFFIFLVLSTPFVYLLVKSVLPFAHFTSSPSQPSCSTLWGQSPQDHSFFTFETSLHLLHGILSPFAIGQFPTETATPPLSKHSVTSFGTNQLLLMPSFFWQTARHR